MFKKVKIYYFKIFWKKNLLNIIGFYIKDSNIMVIRIFLKY